MRGVLGKDSITWRRDSREARPGFHLRRNVVEGDRMRRHRLGTGQPGGVDLFEGQAAGIRPLHEGQLHDLSSGILLELLRDELMDHLRIPFLRNTHRAEGGDRRGMDLLLITGLIARQTGESNRRVISRRIHNW